MDKEHEKMTQPQAVAYCESIGSSLVSIHSEQDQNELVFQCNSHRIWVDPGSVRTEYWLGITDSDTEGDWAWLDGTDTDYGFNGKTASGDPWSKNEPNNHPHTAAGEDCAAAQWWSGKYSEYTWNDRDCNSNDKDNKGFALCNALSTIGCQNLYGGQWVLVRHAYNAWHTASDQLAGTDQYGTYDNDPLSMATWSIPFDKALESDGNVLFMFSNGDCSQYSITSAPDTRRRLSAYDGDVMQASKFNDNLYAEGSSTENTDRFNWGGPNQFVNVWISYECFSYVGFICISVGLILFS